MTETISTLEVRQRLGDMLNRVALRHDEFVIERKGKPLAALVPVRNSIRCAGSPAATPSNSSLSRRAES